MSTDGADILIVEDEEGLAELFDIWLGEHFSVETVTDGPTALDYLGRDFEAVVLDWRMPEVSGADILDRIRSDGLEYQVTIVTGLDPEIEDIDDDVGAILRKPVTREELVDVVRELIE